MKIYLKEKSYFPRAMPSTKFFFWGGGWGEEINLHFPSTIMQKVSIIYLEDSSISTFSSKYVTVSVGVIVGTSVCLMIGVAIAVLILRYKIRIVIH